jgi:hypothetical protein
MIIIASQLSESVLCTLPNGEHVEVIMLVAEQDECFANPSLEAAVMLLTTYFDCQAS